MPLGAFLSGGKDSPAIVAAMGRMGARAVQTFTIGFREASHDEVDDARLSARHLGVEHHERLVVPNAVDVLPELVEHHGEPFADPSAIPTYCLAQMAREHVTVALSGDGGDEVFGGYSRYTWAWGARTLDAMLGPLLPFARNAVGRLERSRRLPPALSRAAQSAAVGLAPEAERYLAMAGHFPPSARDALYTPDFALAIDGPDTVERFDRAVAGSDARAPLDRYVQSDLDGYLTDGIMVKVDIASMIHSLEVRAPFLDHRLVELGARLPVALRQRGLRSRVLYRRAVAPYLPAEILTRKKRGLTLPVDAWLRGPLRSLVDDTVRGGRIRARGHLRPERVEALWDEHLQGRANHGLALWNLLVLELWMRRFLDADAPPRRSAAAVTTTTRPVGRP